MKLPLETVKKPGALEIKLYSKHPFPTHGKTEGREEGQEENTKNSLSHSSAGVEMGSY